MTHGYSHASDLVELAAMVAYHSDCLIQSPNAVSQTGIENYWQASRERFTKWSAELTELSEIAANLRGKCPTKVWHRLRPLMEEVLASEVLTRVWAAVGCIRDEQEHSSSEMEPFVRNAYIYHLDARHRALDLAMHHFHLSDRQVEFINQIRRRSERWSDVLLGYMHDLHPEIAEFAFEPDRVRDFALSLDERQQEGGRDTAHTLVLNSLRAAFRKQPKRGCPNPDQNRRICESVIGCFSNDIFEAIGTFSSSWITRLEQVTDDTQAYLNNLEREETAASLVSDVTTWQPPHGPHELPGPNGKPK